MTEVSIDFLKCQNEAEDVRKIHAEINQILHQRFLLVTTAVGVFGAFSAFVISAFKHAAQATTSDTAMWFIFLSGMFMLAFFSLLFFLNLTLLKNQNILSTYLRLANLSCWEQRINSFYKDGVAGTRLYYILYILFGLLAMSWPFLIFLANYNHLPEAYPSIIYILFGVFYILWVCSSQASASNTSEIENRWKTVLSVEASQRKTLAVSGENLKLNTVASPSTLTG